MSTPFDDWVARARAVPIEDELERRGIMLKRVGVEQVGPCPKCGGEDRFAANTAKQIFNCRGCDVGGDVIALVQHLDDSDFKAACGKLAGEPPPQPHCKVRSAEQKKVVAAEYCYEDETGALAFVVERVEYQNLDGTFVLTKDQKRKKTFRRRRPDPDRPGTWLWNVNGVPILPYRLPELTEAVANERKIVIAEGEGKADLLWGWNVPATCCAGGAEKWRAEHTEFLRGADVVILPDNDAAGRKHLAIVAASLQNIAASVRVLDLPGLPPKGDIIDWAARSSSCTI
jgi:DNA primase